MNKVILIINMIFLLNNIVFSQNQWEIELVQSSIDCTMNQVCYQIGLKNISGADWTLGDQNYRLFFDGDLMTVTTVTSLLPNAFYSTPNIDQNIKISGQGQEPASPLDDIDDNLGFLDFSIVQTNKTNPAGATLLVSSFFTTVVEICMDLDASVMNDPTGNTCLSLYHSRPATAGSITNQYTNISENNIPGSTIPTIGSVYNDLTPADVSVACLGLTCAALLPVELIHFEGEYLSKMGNYLEWETAQEWNSDFFEIEYSKDGKFYQVIDVVRAKNQAAQYDFLHEMHLAGEHYYRLKEVSLNGEIAISKTILIQINAEHPFDVFPNPATHSIFIKSTSLQINQYELIDVAGNTIAFFDAKEELFDISHIPKGIYFIKDKFQKFLKKLIIQ